MSYIMSADRTQSRRKRAGSRRNKRLKNVGSLFSDLRQENHRRDYYPDPTWRVPVDHKARAVDIDRVFPQLGSHTH